MLQIFNKKEIKRDEILIWWLGGASFYLKSENKKIIIDPYLSNSAYNELKPFFKDPEKELDRLISPPLEPSEIDCDYYICTHDHLDHLDPDTVKGISEKESITFIGPESCKKHFKKLGIPDKNIITINRGQTLKLDTDFYITAVNAKHRGPLDVEESLRSNKEIYGKDDGQGYILKIDSILVYHTSDTEYLDEFNDLKNSQIDIVLLAANGKAGNLSPEEGVKLIEIINPDVVIPMHFGVIPFTDSDPKILKRLFEELNIKSEIKILDPRDFYIYRKRK